MGETKQKLASYSHPILFYPLKFVIDNHLDDISSFLWFNFSFPGLRFLLSRKRFAEFQNPGSTPHCPSFFWFIVMFQPDLRIIWRTNIILINSWRINDIEIISAHNKRDLCKFKAIFWSAWSLKNEPNLDSLKSHDRRY